MCRYFKRIGVGDHISSWKCKGLSNESIKPHAASDNGLALSLTYISTRTRVKFEGQCLKQDKITFNNGKTVNLYIVYEINFWDRGHDDYATLEKSLFGAFKIVKSADIDKYKYSDYGSYWIW